VIDSAPASDLWLFLPDAALHLNLAPQTIRRKIKRGELESRQVQTKTGMAYQVRLVDRPALSAQATPSQPIHGLSEMVSLLKATQAELLARTEAASLWQARAEFLAGQLQQRDEQLKALQAPREEPKPVDTGDRLPATVAAAEERPRAAWWRRWFQP
jgi:hypothetical protein